MTIEWYVRLVSLVFLVLGAGHLGQLAGFRWSRIETSVPSLNLSWGSGSERRRLGRWGVELVTALALGNLGLMAASKAANPGAQVFLVLAALASAAPSLLLCATPFLPTRGLRRRLEREAKDESLRSNPSPRFLSTLFVQWAVGAGLALFAVFA